MHTFFLAQIFGNQFYEQMYEFVSLYANQNAVRNCRYDELEFAMESQNNTYALLHSNKTHSIYKNNKKQILFAITTIDNTKIIETLAENGKKNIEKIVAVDKFVINKASYIVSIQKMIEKYDFTTIKQMCDIQKFAKDIGKAIKFYHKKGYTTGKFDHNNIFTHNKKMLLAYLENTEKLQTQLNATILHKKLSKILTQQTKTTSIS